MDMFTNPLFIMVLTGTVILGVSSAMVGSITVLNQKSLIGDAIGHSGFPGIVIFFMIFASRSPYILLSGAVTTGLLAYVIISVIDKSSKYKSDTPLAVVLSGFFGLGMALKSHIQGNANYADASQSGLQNYIFGQAAFMTDQDVKLILGVSILALFILILFYKEIKLFVFDREYLKVSGFNPGLVDIFIIVMTIALIAAGLKVVGSILISSMLIAPAVAAMQWSNNYSRVLIIAAIVGGFSCLVGTIWSALGKGISTGPAIVIVMSVIAIFSLIFGKSGVIKTVIKRRRYNA